MQEPLTLNPLGSPFIELQSVDSTNNYARQEIQAADLSDRQGLHGTCFFAHEQVAGKGQRGKSWSSKKHNNIALSIVLKPAIPLSNQFQLSACAAVAMHDFFSKYAGDETSIKWPNDLYWQDRKAGGMLIESVVSSGEQSPEWDWAIIGIGININQTSFPEGLKNPVSLKQITGKDFDPAFLARELFGYVAQHYNRLVSGGFDDCYARYLLYLYKKGKLVKLKKGNRVFAARIVSVTPAGQLLINHAIEETIDFGEVEWLL